MIETELPRHLTRGTDILVPVCTIMPNFNIEDVDPELSMDGTLTCIVFHIGFNVSRLILVIIMKTFDSLTSHEQLLLKCSAILGEVFPRDMLLYIMNTPSERSTALGNYYFK